MKISYIFIMVLILAFLSASLGLCEELDESHGETHHCVASCSGACCKSLVQDDHLMAPPTFVVSAIFTPTQSAYNDIYLCNIEHPPKRAA